jgi:hypothetical protein
MVNLFQGRTHYQILFVLRQNRMRFAIVSAYTFTVIRQISTVYNRATLSQHLLQNNPVLIDAFPSLKVNDRKAIR